MDIRVRPVPVVISIADCEQLTSGQLLFHLAEPLTNVRAFTLKAINIRNMMGNPHSLIFTLRTGTLMEKTTVVGEGVLWPRGVVVPVPALVNLDAFHEFRFPIQMADCGTSSQTIRSISITLATSNNQPILYDDIILYMDALVGDLSG